MISHKDVPLKEEDQGNAAVVHEAAESTHLGQNHQDVAN